MALVISDLHGDREKLKAFLKHKPDEDHIHLGDICDDWTAPDSEIEATIRLAFSKKSKLINIVGNHEIPYMAYSPFHCSGHRVGAKKTFDLIRKHEKEFKLALYVDGYVLTHAGVTSYFRKYNMTPEDVVNYLENQWQEWLFSERSARWKEMEIFWISRISGGTSEHGGPIWARPGFDDIDKSYSQVFGHTERRDGPKIEYHNPMSKVHHVNLDAKRYVCFNTKTKEFENFGHGLTTKHYEMFLNRRN